MKIVFCSTMFPHGSTILRGLLPNDEISQVPAELVPEEARTADVLVPLMYPLTQSLLETTHLKLIQQWGVGLEGVDIPAATSRGVPVCNIPGDSVPNADSTAEHAVFLMMGLSRNLPGCKAAFREGKWGEPMGVGLFARTALIVGLGRVGMALARRLAALGMTVEAIRRSAVAEADLPDCVSRMGVPSDLLEMAARADFVVSTAVLNEETRGLLNRTVFEAMKPDALVVNVSRGPVIEETDLLEALKSGCIAGAGLDVFAQEPVGADHPLLALDNVLATPHIGGVTRQSYEAMSRVVRDNVNLVREGAMPTNCVNPEALQRRSRE
jgi:phosphoglycerate dehydrogenase-like enzyme